MKTSTFRYLASMVFALVAASALVGCASNEPDNLSERPWNAPKSWETGVPQTLMQGR